MILGISAVLNIIWLFLTRLAIGAFALQVFTSGASGQVAGAVGDVAGAVGDVAGAVGGIAQTVAAPTPGGGSGGIAGIPSGLIVLGVALFAVQTLRRR